MRGLALMPPRRPAPPTEERAAMPSLLIPSPFSGSISHLPLSLLQEAEAMAAGPPPRVGRPSERRCRTNAPPFPPLLLPLPPVLSLTSLSLSFAGSHGRRTSMPPRARGRPMTSTLPPVLSGHLLVFFSFSDAAKFARGRSAEFAGGTRTSVQCRLSYTRGMYPLDIHWMESPVYIQRY
ncbi:hypothetical protein VPH35_019406 [Triticum aestivum]